MTTSQKNPALYVETVSGKFVDPCNPDPSTIDIADIAWSLSRISRFVGHTITTIPYNVAQHSIYVSDLLEQFLNDPFSFSTVQNVDIPELVRCWKRAEDSGSQKNELLLHALFHDAHEAYIGDMPSPIKKIPALRPVIKQIEHDLDAAIISKLELRPLSTDEEVLVKFGDKLAQSIEGYHFMPSRGRDWDLPKPPITLLQRFPAPLDALTSMRQFMNRFENIAGQGHN